VLGSLALIRKLAERGAARPGPAPRPAPQSRPAPALEVIKGLVGAPPPAVPALSPTPTPAAPAPSGALALLKRLAERAGPPPPLAPPPSRRASPTATAAAPAVAPPPSSPRPTEADLSLVDRILDTFTGYPAKLVDGGSIGRLLSAGLVAVRDPAGRSVPPEAVPSTPDARLQLTEPGRTLALARKDAAERAERLAREEAERDRALMRDFDRGREDFDLAEGPDDIARELRKARYAALRERFTPAELWDRVQRWKAARGLAEAAAAPLAPAPAAPPASPARLAPEEEFGPFPSAPLKLAGGIEVSEGSDGYLKLKFPDEPKPGTVAFAIKREISEYGFTFYRIARAWTRKLGKKDPDNARQFLRQVLARHLGEDGRVPGNGARAAVGGGASATGATVPAALVGGIVVVALADRGWLTFTPTTVFEDDRVKRKFVCACYGGRHDPRTDTYRVHVENAPTTIKTLSEAGFTLDVAPGVAEAIDAAARAQSARIEAAAARANAIDAQLRSEGGELFDHQRQGIDWIASRQGRGLLLADDMGLGKTLQTSVSLPPGRPVLVLCPSIVKPVWAEECERWRRDYRPEIREGSDGWRWPRPGEMVIVNYDILPACSVELRKALVAALNGEETATGEMRKLAGRVAAIQFPNESLRFLAYKALEDDLAREARAIAQELHNALLARRTHDHIYPIRVRLVDALNGATRAMKLLAERVADDKFDLNFDTLDTLAYDPALEHPLAHRARLLFAPIREALAREATVPEGMILLADEAHKLGNPSAQRTMRVWTIAEAARAKGGETWAITATPLRSKPPQLLNVLRVAGVDREVFCDYMDLAKLFGADVGPRGGVSDWGDGKKASPELPERLRRVELRRTKAQLNLPPLTYRTVYAEIDTETARKADAALASLRDKGVSLEEAVEELARTTLKFREISSACAAMATAKIPTLLRLVEEYERQREPLVVFSAYLSPVDLLGDRPGWGKLAGAVPKGERRRVQREFQAGRMKGLAATIDAGGVGITLTRAANLILSDRKFVPADNDQARDRIHRIGQKRPCTVTLVVADHPLDRKIDEILRKKAGLVAASVDAAAVERVEITEAEGWETLAREAADLVAEAQEAARRGELERAQRRRVEVHKAVAEAAARRLREALVENAPTRGPQTDTERRAAEGLVRVAALDPDRAQTLNGVGFNKADNWLGHAIAFLLRDAAAPALTDQQWRIAVDLAHTYRRQIGEVLQGALGAQAVA
jgi:hypothetical protein